MNYKKLAVATMVVLGLQLTIANSSDKDHSNVHWIYKGETGHANWGYLSDKYALCATGKRQSPIDITESVKANLPSLEFNYSQTPLIIENNGHTIKMTTDKAGTLKIGQESYKLLQIHTHTPSETAINGKRFDMIIHMVHKNAQDELAVVAVLLEAGDMANPLIEILWKVMPKIVVEPQHYDTQIDVNQLLPQDKNYYTFEGSLTTPPCSEGVKWVILKQPVSISGQQLAQYRALYHNNARPLQPQNGRRVLSSN